MICKNCGTKIAISNALHKDVVRCPGCGTVYRRKPTTKRNDDNIKQSNTKRKTCSVCGLAFEGDEVYCPACGNLVDDSWRSQQRTAERSNINQRNISYTDEIGAGAVQRHYRPDHTSHDNKRRANYLASNQYVSAETNNKDKQRNKKNSVTVGVLLLLVFAFSLVGIRMVQKIITTTDNTTDSEISNSTANKQIESQITANATNQISPLDRLFRDGPLLAMGDNSLWGYIDENSDWVVEPKYNNWIDSLVHSYNDAGFASQFNNGRAVIQDSSTGYFGVIDTKGNWIVEQGFLSIKEFQNGLAVAQDASTSNWGFINEDYQWVLEPRFKNLRSFQEGLAAACDANTGKWGFIDHNGNWIIEPIFRNARSFVSGYAPVQDNEKYIKLPGETVGAIVISGEKRYCWGYIDKNGNYLLEPQYMDAYGFQEGLAPVQSLKTEKWGFIDESAQLEIPCQFTRVTSFNNGRSFASMSSENDDLVLLIETNGATHKLPSNYTPNCIETDNDTLEYVSWVQNSLILHGNNNSNCVIDLNGNVLFNDKGFDGTISGIANEIGRFYVKDSSGKKGVMDKNYNWIIEPKYSSIQIIDNEYVASGSYYDDVFDLDGQFLRKNDREGNPILILCSEVVDGKTKIGYKDFDGNLIIQCLFEKRGSTATQFSEYAVVGFNGLTGVIDSHGEWLVEPKFQDIDCIKYMFS